jgi:hypothetical protein
VGVSVEREREKVRERERVGPVRERDFFCL